MIESHFERMSVNDENESNNGGKLYQKSKVRAYLLSGPRCAELL